MITVIGRKIASRLQEADQAPKLSLPLHHLDYLTGPRYSSNYIHMEKLDCRNVPYRYRHWLRNETMSRFRFGYYKSYDNVRAKVTKIMKVSNK